MAEQQLQKSLALIKEGNKTEAIELVKSIIKRDNNNVKAWWIMANLLENPAQQEKAVQRILALQPRHPGATKLLASLGGTTDTTEMPQSESVETASTDIHNMQLDWSKLEARDGKQKRKTSPEKDAQTIDQAKFIASSIIITALAVVALMSLNVVLNGGPLLMELESKVERYMVASFEGRYSDANRFLCTGRHFSADFTYNPASRIDNAPRTINTSAVDVSINWEDDPFISVTVTGNVILTYIDAGSRTREVMPVDEFVSTYIISGIRVDHTRFLYENHEWVICPGNY